MYGNFFNLLVNYNYLAWLLVYKVLKKDLCVSVYKRENKKETVMLI